MKNLTSSDIQNIKNTITEAFTHIIYSRVKKYDLNMKIWLKDCFYCDLASTKTQKLNFTTKMKYELRNAFRLLSEDKVIIIK